MKNKGTLKRNNKNQGDGIKIKAQVSEIENIKQLQKETANSKMIL